MTHTDIKPGDILKARYNYDHNNLIEGQAYEVIKVDAPTRMDNGFTFPAYVTVKRPNGKPYTSHLHHYTKES